MSTTTQYGLLARGADIIRWYQETHNGAVLKGGGIPERNAFVAAIRTAGYDYWSVEEKVDAFKIDLVVFLLETTEPLHADNLEVAVGKNKLCAAYPTIFNASDLFYYRVKGIDHSPTRVYVPPGEPVVIVEEQSVKRQRDSLDADDIQIVPVLPDRAWSLQERTKRVLSMNGSWLEFDNIQNHIVLVYKDASFLTLILNCENSSDHLVFQEDHSHLISRLYQQIINCFFDSLASNAIVIGDRTLLMGARYERFEKVRFSTINKNKSLRIAVSFECLCQDAETEEEQVNFCCDETDLVEYLYVLSEFVNDHVDRPRK